MFIKWLKFIFFLLSFSNMRQTWTHRRKVLHRKKIFVLYKNEGVLIRRQKYVFLILWAIFFSFHYYSLIKTHFIRRRVRILDTYNILIKFSVIKKLLLPVVNGTRDGVVFVFYYIEVIYCQRLYCSIYRTRQFLTSFMSHVNESIKKKLIFNIEY